MRVDYQVRHRPVILPGEVLWGAEPPHDAILAVAAGDLVPLTDGPRAGRLDPGEQPPPRPPPPPTFAVTPHLLATDRTRAGWPPLSACKCGLACLQLTSWYTTSRMPAWMSSLAHSLQGNMVTYTRWGRWWWVNTHGALIHRHGSKTWPRTHAGEGGDALGQGVVG